MKNGISLCYKKIIGCGADNRPPPMLMGGPE